MMKDLCDTTPPVRAWDVKVRKGEAESFLQRQVEAAKEAGAELLVVRADLVFGTDHIGSAVLHARRAIEEKRNSSESLAIETLLYISGERQLSSAIKKMSVGPSTTEVVVAQLSPGRPLAEADWAPLPAVRALADVRALMAFGITEAELHTVPADRRAELVLERVASVDITKR